MKKVIKTSPTVVRLEGFSSNELKPHLDYIDKSVDFELAKARNSKWLLNKLGEEGWREHINNLKAERNKTLLFEDEQGFWTYSGLGSWLAGKFQAPYEDLVEYPESKNIPWAKIPNNKLRPYQEESNKLLLAKKHSAVELATGTGKTTCILYLAKELGLKTVVMTPSVSIAYQILTEFETYLGKKLVGQFFDGKKESKKLFTVAVDDSLAKVVQGDSHWANLSSAKVFIADESHLCPAKTLAKVCTGLLAAPPYRFFFSGTQLRNDGLDLVLDAITGPVVYRMSVEEGVKQGYLAQPMFRMIAISSESSFYSQDANETTRRHLFYNDQVNQSAAKLANLLVSQLNRQVVILVKEIEQFTHLLPYLEHPTRFAHGPLTKENKFKIPEQYHESDTTKIVDDFNQGLFPILIGTSCITTGTDIRPVGAIIFLRGNKSEIDLKQSIGRGTRRPPGKDDFFFFDYNITNIDTLRRHAIEREKIYRSVYPDYEDFKF